MMKPEHRPSQEYLRNVVLTSSPEQLQLMLYDGALRFANEGLSAIQAQDRDAAFRALERAQLIVLELSNGTRREVNPEIADRMLSLYNFVWRRLVDANIYQDEQALREALRVLQHQRESWVLLLEKLRRELAGAAPHDPGPPESGSERVSSFVAEA